MTRLLSDPAKSAISWARSALPHPYAMALESLVADSVRDKEVVGVLLTGSMARRDALAGTDIDVRIITRDLAAPEFSQQLRLGVLTEQTLTTERFARSKLLENPMHVYAYLDGVSLYDADGSLARLRATADQVRSDYKVSKTSKQELAHALSHPEEKTRTAFKAGDLLKATYTLSTSSWQIIEGLWAANNLPLPPNASVRPHLRDLRGPDGVEEQFAELFLGQPSSRIETGLHLLSWIRSDLLAAL